MRDKIEIFGERLKKVVEGFQTMKTFGLDEEILVSYMCHKLKLSEKQVKRIISCQEEFYNKLLKEAMAAGLEK